MAGLSVDSVTGLYRVTFRFKGKSYQKSLRTAVESEANARKVAIEELLDGMTRGVIDTPALDNLWTVLFSGGRIRSKDSAARSFTLYDLFERYQSDMPSGTMEPKTIETLRLHRKHLLSFFGEKLDIDKIEVQLVQSYVNARARASWRGKPIKPRTVKKELATLRVVWNWGKSHGLILSDSPVRNLRFEKEDQRQAFRTWEEIERRVRRGGLTKDDAQSLWDSVFLSTDQINECLQHVKNVARQPFIYPMLVMAAHTGARRSEMIRSLIDDIDFASGSVSIREKKRNKNVKETVRVVQMSPTLRKVLGDWLEAHPGGKWTFTLGDLVVAHSTKRKQANRAGLGIQPLTPQECVHHFRTTMNASKWQVLRGFHVFRHSFASNLAAAGVRQEVIDELMGHQTEDMRRRYRHLFPHETGDAIRKMWG